MKLRGLVVAVTTPFGENGEIDAAVFERHIEWLEAKGVSRILVNGTTGEFFSLTCDERHGLLEIARNSFGGSVLFHVATSSLRQARKSAEFAAGMGADAVVALPPHYFAEAPVDGIIGYFEELQKSTSLPLVLYNFPKHTNNPITAEILKNVEHAAVKDSSADLSLITATPCYLIGGDRKILDMHHAGGAGFVTGAANFAPKPFVEMEKALAEGDMSKAEKLQVVISEFKSITSGAHGIGQIKQEIRKSIDGYPLATRLPLV